MTSAKKTTRANGITFSYLEQGEGPLVLLLHGFPDNADTWSPYMHPLADAGYRVVAPFLRGYPPTEIPADGFYDTATLATDIRELIETLEGVPAYVVGHDWGAAITYSFLAAFPSLVRRAVVMAVPHPKSLMRVLMSPEQIHRSFHWWFFQIRDLPEMAITANDFAFIDYLWEYWSPGHQDRDHIAQIKKMLAEPGALESALGYYRAVLDPAKSDPRLSETRALIDRPIAVPTLALFGSKDERTEFAEVQAEFFTGPYRAEIIPDCGHFLQREKPDEVTRLILDWLREGD